MRLVLRANVTLIYRKPGNLRAVQLLLGYMKNDSTIQYLGIAVEAALALSKKTKNPYVEGLELM